MILGDVCGHGREALERAALMRYTVRAYLQAGLEPRAALALAGQALADPDAHFATVAAGVYDSAEVARLTYACAGHPAPIVLGPGARPCRSRSAARRPSAGASPRVAARAASRCPAGRAVCFFTDGLTEARCEDGLLGSERLAELLESDWARTRPRVRSSSGSPRRPAPRPTTWPPACWSRGPAQAPAGAGAHRGTGVRSQGSGQRRPEPLPRGVRPERAHGPPSSWARAERALACGETAVLTVEFAHGEVQARIDVPEQVPRPGSPGSGERRSVSPLPAHAGPRLRLGRPTCR